MKHPPLLRILFVCLLFSLPATAQNDQEQLAETMAWLENKTNIAYYNAQTQEWWSNRLFYSEDSGVINIRSTSSDGPSFLSRNSYYDRKVQLSDLDASSIRVHDIKEDQGRIVYGQVVQVNTIGNQKLIKRVKNERPSFNEFFLQIPVPHSIDSMHLTADSIKMKLTLAIELASKIKPTDSEAANAGNILQVLHGRFKGSDGSTCSFDKITDIDMELELGDETGYIRKGLIGFDQEANQFYLWDIHKGKREQLQLSIRSEEKIYLHSESPAFRLTLHGSNHFSILENGVKTDFYREME